MKQYDTQLESRVWQRVQQSTPQEQLPKNDAQDLLALIAARWAGAATYQQLSRRLQGKDSATARRLFEDEQANTACLRGIYILVTGKKPEIPKPMIPQETVAVTLRRCYGNEIRCLAHYEARMAQRDYGHVFARLAEQKRSHCMLVLELIGRMEK